MNYLDSQKKKEEQASRMSQPSSGTEEEVEDFVPLSLDAPATPVPSAPAEPEEPAPKAKPEKKDKPPKPPRNPRPPKKHKIADSEDADKKDRLNIFLEPDIATNLRIICAMTRKSLSYVIERSLRNTITRHYRCNDPACRADFSVIDNDEPPKHCPYCGKSHISYVAPPDNW